MLQVRDMRQRPPMLTTDLSVSQSPADYEKNMTKCATTRHRITAELYTKLAQKLIRGPVYAKAERCMA